MRTIHPIKNIIAVGSGKGGVGKSTVALNLAVTLARAGSQVGLLDADIYGPNQPKMLGVDAKPNINEEKQFEPILAHGVFSMSIGYLVDNAAPIVWRGPMASKAVEQLLRDTLWPPLDYLIIDLPPGTGDIQLTLSSKISLKGVIVVTTPQEIALLDVRKGIEMFQKVNTPVLGLVENMSLHECSVCGHQDAIFGEGGGEATAKQYNIPFLGKLPLDSNIRASADMGTPIVEIDQTVAEIYRGLIEKITLPKRSKKNFKY